MTSRISGSRVVEMLKRAWGEAVELLPGGTKFSPAARGQGLFQSARRGWKAVRGLVAGVATLVIFSFATCKYSFKDTSPIPAEVKTFRVNFFENKARYVNPQLGPQLTEATKQKIIGNTRLRQTNDDNAHYDIAGYVSEYNVTTSGISGNNASANRLSVAFHLVFKNTLDPTKNFETDVSNNFDFPATQTLETAQASLFPDIVKNIVDAIFNKIFSNW